MLEIFAHDPSRNEYRTEIPESELPALIADPEVHFWVDLFQPTEAEIQVLSQAFHLDPLAIEDCIHPRQFPKIETFPTYLFFIIQGIVPPQEGNSTHHIELDCFLTDRFLITHRTDTIPGIEASKKRILEKHSRLEGGVTYLAYEILDQLIDMYIPVLDFFDERINGLEQSIGRKPFTERSAFRYLKLSRQIIDLRRISMKNQDVFYHLSHSAMKFIDADEARLFRDIYDHVARVVDMTEYYQEGLRSILDIHLSLASNRVNQVVQYLTIIATIMLPLNVVTGVYGMNFRVIPLAELETGFYIILALMAVIAGGMIYSFHRRKWI